MSAIGTGQRDTSGGSPRPKLLLLFGTPRSGTSWLGKVFDSHPKTLYKHEPDRSGFNVPFAPPISEAERWRDTVRNFVRHLPANNTSHVAARLPVFAKDYRLSLAEPIHYLSVLASDAAALVRWPLPVLQCANPNQTRVHLVWKSTDSLGRLGVILHAFEECRALRIIRHPCGYVASVLRGEAQQKFVGRVRTCENYGPIEALLKTENARSRGLTVEHMRRFHPVERMAWNWVLLNEKAEDDSRDNPRCTVVRYEDVCRDPLNATKELFSFCGLEWNQQTSGFLEASTLATRPNGWNRITQNSRRYYSIFRNPLESAEKWKLEMKAEDVARIFCVLRQSDLGHLYPEPESTSLLSFAGNVSN